MILSNIVIADQSLKNERHSMEEWTRWEPVEGIQGTFFIEDFHVTLTGLSIQMCSEKNNTKIKIAFPIGVETYRCTNESWCFDVFAQLGLKYGDDFYVNWSFFKIENSNYVKSLSLTSARLSESTRFHHFCIVGADEILDILVRYQPTVTMIS